MIENYSLEIDFLPVGDGSKSGDAIAMRYGIYGNPQWQNQKVIIIDGGNKDSGNALVKHVQEVYNTNKVDQIILTHPDADHASGLTNVIEGLDVGEIWMHRPWNHWADIKDSIVDGRITKKSFDGRMRQAYQYAHDVEQLAIQKKIKIVAPHQGLSISIGNEKILTILGPSKELYLSLIQASGKTPDMNIFESTRTFNTEAKKTVIEDMSFESESLTDTDIPTSAENDMSLIMLLNVASSKVLFTGDAGTQGLFKSIMYCIEQNISLLDLNVFDVPHHGSRKNLSKGILKYISAKYSIISCAIQGGPKHPSPIVTNSLIRRNMNPYVTQGRMLTYRSKGTPPRKGLVAIQPVQFKSVFEI